MNFVQFDFLIVNIDSGLKFFILLFLLVYAVYAGLLFKQISLLNRSIRTPKGAIFSIFGLLHFFLSFLLLAFVALSLFVAFV